MDNTDIYEMREHKEYGWYLAFGSKIGVGDIFVEYVTGKIKPNSDPVRLPWSPYLVTNDSPLVDTVTLVEFSSGQTRYVKKEELMNRESWEKVEHAEFIVNKYIGKEIEGKSVQKFVLRKFYR